MFPFFKQGGYQGVSPSPPPLHYKYGHFPNYSPPPVSSSAEKIRADMNTNDSLDSPTPVTLLFTPDGSLDPQVTVLCSPDSDQTGPLYTPYTPKSIDSQVTQKCSPLSPVSGKSPHGVLSPAAKIKQHMIFDQLRDRLELLIEFEQDDKAKNAWISCVESYVKAPTETSKAALERWKNLFRAKGRSDLGEAMDCILKAAPWQVISVRLTEENESYDFRFPIQMHTTFGNLDWFLLVKLEEIKELQPLAKKLSEEAFSLYFTDGKEDFDYYAKVISKTEDGQIVYAKKEVRL